MRWRISKPITLNELTRGPNLARGVIRWALTGRGVRGDGAGIVFGFVKTRPELATPDVQFHLAHASYADAATRKLEREPGMTLAVCPLRSESRGSIHVKSADPSVPPAIRGNFMSDPTDRSAARRVGKEGVSTGNSRWWPDH